MTTFYIEICHYHARLMQPHPNMLAILHYTTHVPEFLSLLLLLPYPVL